MYNERKDNLNIKDVVLQISFVLLFIFLLIWLFPTRSYIDKTVETIEKEKFLAKYERFRSQGESYLLNDDSITEITLGYMEENDLLLDFDYDECDLDNSYVRVYLEDENYFLESNLECQDFVQTNIYDFSYPDSEDTSDEEDVIDEDLENDDETNDEEVRVPPIEEEIEVSYIYKYEYRLVENGEWSNWGEWSDWTSEKLEVTASRRREVKEVDGAIYYRYINRNFIAGKTHIEFSDSKEDESLLDKGYQKTGGKIRM